jgi:hypothetical protein
LFRGVETTNQLNNAGKWSFIAEKNIDLPESMQISVFHCSSEPFSVLQGLEAQSINGKL